ncbi:MMPL family transporter [Alkalimonas delamerensis]|uniref:MMPL family transporter n=1 Tax=Alkalimonas delamerensis TaxID=265981 RepID=A0ABT9GSM4_9GAMM|nr:MMPL family transporter [Alkalimonas delamerensis]MDP4529981.1 MMPL family transporter [Alkalimonas delamerensis]
MQQLWLNSALHHPLKTICLALLAVAIMAAGMSNLYFRGDYRIFFSPDNPQMLAFEQMQDEFNKTDNILIALAPSDGDVFTEHMLELIWRYTEEAWQTPYSSRVDSLTNFQHTEALDDDLLVEDLLLHPGQLSAEKVVAIRRVAMSEPALYRNLVAADGRVAAINITVQLPEIDQNQEVVDAYEFVLELSAQFAADFPGVRFYHGGILPLNYAFASEAEKDASTLVPLMFLVIVLMLLLLLRSFAAAMATVIIIVVTILSTLGIAGWLGIFLSTATVNVPTIVMTLAVADCVHVIASMQYALRQGKSKDDAIQYSMTRNLMPIFITSITTSIGFLTLNFSEVPILRDLGNMTALGVMLACLFSVTLLPALLRLLPAKVVPVSHTANGIEKLADFVVAQHRTILPVGLLLMLVLAAFAATNQVNDVAVKYFDKRTEFRQSLDFIEDNLTGTANLDFAIDSGTTSGVNNPAFLADVARFVDWLELQPEVTHVASITHVFKRLNKNMHQDNPDYYRLPEQQDLAAQYLLMYEMSLPFGLDLNNQLNLDKSATRVTATLQSLGSKELTGFEQRALDWLALQLPDYQSSAASTPLMFAHIGERNMASMLKTLPVALILISALLVISLRSWRLGLFSLVPNIMPALVGFGIWALYSGEINLGLSVVASISLGIIVDDTVHFLSKYQRGLREGQDTEGAVRYAFYSVGRALFVTTVVLAAGFAVLTMSGFRLNSDMGLLTGLIILLALVIDLLVLPALLLRFDKKGKTDETIPAHNAT